MSWKKRETVQVECPSGTVCSARRMGPELSLRAGKVQRLFQRAEQTEGRDPQEKWLSFLETLSDEEVVKMGNFATEVVLDTVVSPKLVANPKGPDEIGPKDMPLSDFWFLFSWALNLAREVPVQLTQGETTVDAVETFPTGQATDALSGLDGQSVQ